MHPGKTVAYPFVSIIILNYNGIRYLKNLFESLVKTDYPKDLFEVIMGDNGSTDDSVKFTEEHFAFVRVLRFDKNYGFCKGNNLCAQQAIGKYVVFLNTDMIVTKDWLKSLVEAVLNDTTAISAGAKLLKPYEINGKKVIDYAGGKLTSEINFYEGLLEFDCQRYSNQKSTGFACGAAVLVDKEFFLLVGGFDEYYFGGGEEVELGFRVWQYGHKVLYVPSSVIYHLRYGTFKESDPFPTYNWAKSMFYFIFKNYGKKYVAIYSFESLLMTHLPKIMVFIVNKDLSLAKSVLKGIADFFIELKTKKILEDIYLKRQPIKKNAVISDNDMIKLSVTASLSEKMQYRIRQFKNWNSVRPENQLVQK